MNRRSFLKYSAAVLVAASLLGLIYYARQAPPPAEPVTATSTITATTQITSVSTKTLARGNLDGTWNGTAVQFGTDTNRQWGFQLVISQDAGSSIFSGSMRFTGPTNETYQIQEGHIDGNDVYFSESNGRYFWGVLAGNRISGKCGWNCYGCSQWGTFDVSYVS